MRKVQRLFSGAVLGSALLFGAQALAPRALPAQNSGFCFEWYGATICCSTDSAGTVKDCRTVVVSAE